MNKKSYTIGLLQALGVVVYCGLIGGFFSLAGRFFPTAPDVVAAVLMLITLVFSAAVTGSLVFAYPAYLFLKGQTKQALIILIYTLLYCLIAIIIGLVLVSVL